MTAMPVNLNGRDQYTLSSLHLRLRYQVHVMVKPTVLKEPWKDLYDALRTKLVITSVVR